jgi:hypothetical protein
MLKQKQAGTPIRKEAPVSAPSTVINLMDALRRSIQKEQPAAKKGKVTSGKGQSAGGEAEGGLIAGAVGPCVAAARLRSSASISLRVIIGALAIIHINS